MRCSIKEQFALIHNFFLSLKKKFNLNSHFKLLCGKKMASKKTKKCTICHKYAHECSITQAGLRCRCFLRDCCMCAIFGVAPEPTIPRPCPCANAVCQQEWDEDTKNEKQNRDLQQHCITCHVNEYSKLGTHCEICQRFVCMSCKQTRIISPTSVSIIYPEEEDADVDLCERCKLEWVRTMAVKADEAVRNSEKHKIAVYTALRVLERTTATNMWLSMCEPSKTTK